MTARHFEMLDGFCVLLSEQSSDRIFLLFSCKTCRLQYRYATGTGRKVIRRAYFEFDFLKTPLGSHNCENK
jgi:hypothetical protein